MIDEKNLNDKKTSENKSGKSKIERVLDLYTRLSEGRIINKAETALGFGVDGRTVQRDIADINRFLEERRNTGTADTREVKNVKSVDGYVMTGLEDTLLSNSEILAVSKILLESRAFTKKEIDGILDKIVSGCVPKESMKLVKELLGNEKIHYVEIDHESYIEGKLWEMAWEIGPGPEKCNLLEILYQKQETSTEAVMRIVQPLAILFSEYYFYLNANIVEKNEAGIYVPKYDYPAVFRIDRIRKYHRLEEKIRTEYKDRFEEGEFRKRIQFMYMGPLTTLRFKYTGKSIESVLDRLPTAKVKSKPTEQDPAWLLDAEVYGRGALMWLLTQGTMVEVVGPPSARQEMKTMLQEMLAKYE